MNDERLEVENGGEMRLLRDDDVLLSFMVARRQPCRRSEIGTVLADPGFFFILSREMAQSHGYDLSFLFSDHFQRI